MTGYIGRIETRFPAELTYAQFHAAEAAFRVINYWLSLPINQTAYKSRAVEMAAFALASSGFGAYGYANAVAPDYEVFC